MKTTAKITAFLLALTLLFTLCACGEPVDVTGKWNYNFNLKDAIGNALNSDSSSLSDTEKAVYDALMDSLSSLDKVKMLLTIEFTKDGTYSTSVDGESVSKATELIEESIDDAIPSIMKSLNITEDTLKSLGLSSDTLADQLCKALNISGLVDSISSGKYRVDGNSLYFGDDTSSCIKIKRTGNELEFTELVGSGDEVEIYRNYIFPMTFTKAS